MREPLGKQACRTAFSGRRDVLNRPCCRSQSSAWVPVFALGLAALLAGPAAAQRHQRPPGFDGAAIVEKPNARVPLDIDFRDEDGRPVRLGDFFQADRPVLLSMVYFRCPMLCGLTLNGIVQGVQPLQLTPGRDFEIVTVCFDPREGPELARENKEKYLGVLGRPEAAAAWHFLTSPEPSAARTLGDAIGFGYKLDPKGEFYLHQSALYVCTPDGRVSRTIQGVQFDPDVLRDSLINASAGTISSGLFGVALSCGLVHYDPATGKYTWAAVAIMRVTGLLTILVLGTVIGTLIVRDKKRKQGAAAGPPAGQSRDGCGTTHENQASDEGPAPQSPATEERP